MAEDGTITIGADTSGVRTAMGLLEEELAGLERQTGKNAEGMEKYGNRLEKSLGKKSGLMGNLKGVSSILSSVSSKTSGMASAVQMLGKEGASVGTRVQGGINLASQAVAAFAGPGGMVVGAITLIAGLAIGLSELFKNTQEDAEKTTEELEELAKAAEAANKSIFELEIEGKLKEQREAILATEEELRLKQNDVELTKKLNDQVKAYQLEQERLRRAQRLAAASFLAREKAEEKVFESNRKRREKRRKDRKKAADDEDKAQRKRQSKARASRRKLASQRRKEDEDSAFGGLRLLTLSGERAVRIRRINRQKEREEYEAWEAEQIRLENEAEIKRRDDEAKELAARRKANEEGTELGRQFLEEAKAQDLELAAWKAEQRREEAKAREEEMQDLIKQSRDFSDVARTGFSTITSELFNMAKAGEFSAQKMLNATISAIGQEMVAKGTQFAFEGAAKALAGDPRGVGIAGIGAGMIAAGVGLGAAAGSGEATAAAAEATGAGGAAPVDTRQTRAASGATAESGGPVVITFQGDVYDKRGVANVLNQGLGMARHRRLRGA